MRIIPLAAIFAVALAVSSATAQQVTTVVTSPDADLIERGRSLLAAQCGFCHGTNARGGAAGADLTRSPIVQEDEQGERLGKFLESGRPDRGMPAFDLKPEQVRDLSAFLQSLIASAANRRAYAILDIVTGDAAAGRTFFEGTGGCTACHSTARDLARVGAKYDAVTLQGRIVMPRAARPAPEQPAYLAPNAVTATITAAEGETRSGPLVRLTEFEVSVYDMAAGEVRTWTRSGNAVAIVLRDPLQGHVDLWTKLTDTDLHNLTAYLTGLK